MEKPANSDQSIDPKRLDQDHMFQFCCHPGVSCFTRCCRDVTIVLTPYDVLRLKNGLGLPSDEFLDLHTLILPKENRLIPMVVLKMDKQDKRCTLVTDKGCKAYNDRPWSCRMYPLDMNDDGTFRLITDATHCKGLEEDENQLISEWLIDQGVPIYDEMNHLFTQVTSPLSAENLDVDNPQIHKMVFMALYNLDKFRGFVFNSTFLDRFEVEDITVEKIKRSDIELLKFAMDWIKFGLFGQKTFQVKQPQKSAESNT